MIFKHRSRAQIFKSSSFVLFWVFFLTKETENIPAATDQRKKSQIYEQVEAFLVPKVTGKNHLVKLTVAVVIYPIFVIY